MTHEEWIKDAQRGVEEVGEVLVKRAQSDESGGLSGIWNAMEPGTRQALINSLIGGALGATVMGGAGAATAVPGESRMERALKYGLLGGAGGAITGGAGTKAYELLTQGRQLPGETEVEASPVAEGADVLTEKFLRNPLLTAGTLGGAVLAGKYGLTGEKDLLEGLSKTQPSEARAAAQDIVKQWKKGRTVSAVGSGANAGSMAMNKPGVIGQLINQLKGRLPGAQVRAMKSGRDAGITALKGLSKGKGMAGLLGLAALPVGALIGYGGDRYLRGDYE
jgi:hypothetical protein